MDKERFRIIVEVLTAPAVAVLFWMMIFVIVLLTSARGSFWEANFFEAFGAIGQVGFAAAVFWLGLQQFQFSKKVDARQRRFELHDRRSKLIGDYIAWSKEWLTESKDETDISTLIRLAMHSKALFSNEVSADYYRIIDQYTLMGEAIGEMLEAKSSGDPIEFGKAYQKRRGHLTKALLIEAKMRAQMTLEIDETSEPRDVAGVA